MNIPTFEQIEKLHKKYAPSQNALEAVFTHSCIVRDIVKQLGMGKLKINLELAEAGALIHDIGVYLLYNDKAELVTAKYITHGSLGYELLKKEGFNEELCRFALFHTGVGITKKEIISNNLPLFPRDYFAESTEEKLVMYADKFHSKSIPPAFNSIEHYKKQLQKFGEDKVDKFDSFIKTFGKPDLEKLANKYSQEII